MTSELPGEQVEAIRAGTWNYSEPADDASPVDVFLRAACLNYAHDAASTFAAAQQMLAGHPELTDSNIAVAAVCGDLAAVRRLTAADPGCAARPTGPYGWSPLFYLAYGRIATDRNATLACARLLLEAGADPNDGRFFGGLPIPFTVLTGVFGGGEQDQPPHPHARALAGLLLDRGAEPNDGQTLYNRMFRTDDDAFELLLERGLGQGVGGVWHRMLPDLLAPPAVMVAGLLEWAVTHDQRERVALLARHGVDVLGPLPRGRTPLHVALVNGYGELAAQLRLLGAPDPVLSPVQQFLAAALAADEPAVRALGPKVLDAAQARRPALVVWAASQGRLDAVVLLVSLGFDVNALGRGDLPVEQPWQTALHTAVERDNATMVERLLALGADPTICDARYDGTPLDWAVHLGRPALVTRLTEQGRAAGA